MELRQSNLFIAGFDFLSKELIDEMHVHFLSGCFGGRPFQCCSAT